MRNPSGGLVNITLDFPERSLARDFLQRLAAQLGENLDVLRARITEKEARYEINLRDLSGRIEKASRLCAERGVRFRVLESKTGS